MNGNGSSVLLNPSTLAVVEQLARAWGVSKEEAARRAVTQATVGCDSVEPHFERSEVSRASISPFPPIHSRCSLRSRLLRRQSRLNGVSPHRIAVNSSLPVRIPSGKFSP